MSPSAAPRSRAGCVRAYGRSQDVLARHESPVSGPFLPFGEQSLPALSLHSPPGGRASPNKSHLAGATVHDCLVAGDRPARESSFNPPGRLQFATSSNTVEGPALGAIDPRGCSGRLRPAPMRRRQSAARSLVPNPFFACSLMMMPPSLKAAILRVCLSPRSKAAPTPGAYAGNAVVAQQAAEFIRALMGEPP